jgi:hypothetical protein
LFQRLANEEFQLADFVSAQREPRLIVPLDEQFRAAEFARESFQPFKGRGQMRERNAGK